MKKISTTNAPQAIGPYSQAIATENFVFTSGQLPVTPSGKLVAEDIERQTEQVLSNLSAVLNAEGLALTNVVKTTVFLTDLGQFQQMNAIYQRALGDHRPARSTIQVAALPLGALIEIEAVASR